MTTDQGDTTQLITSLEETPALPQRRQLTDEDILSDPGMSGLLWEAYVAFLTDPGYVTEMVEAANKGDKQRRRWQP